MALPDVQVVVSGLPFTTLGHRAQDRIIDALGALMPPGSLLRTFQYAHAYGWPSAARFRQKAQAHFGALRRSRVVLWNLPPAFVLTWTRAPLRAADVIGVEPHRISVVR